jgi:hypothetical protein
MNKMIIMTCLLAVGFATGCDDRPLAPVGEGGTGGTAPTCDDCFQDGCVECSIECPEPCTEDCVDGVALCEQCKAEVVCDEPILCLERVTTCERVCEDGADSDSEQDRSSFWDTDKDRDCCEEVCTDTFVEIECPADVVSL